MTLAPLIRPLLFPDGVISDYVGPYELNKVCAHPFCNVSTKDTHHLFRRQGHPDADWVYVDLPDIGWRYLPTKVGLCRRHHDDVSGGVGGHRAWIRWIEPENQFGWLVQIHKRVTEKGLIREPATGEEKCSPDRACFDWEMIGYLDPHPPLDGRLQPPAQEPSIERGSSSDPGVPPSSGALPVHSHELSDGKCQTCGQRLPKPKDPNAKPRQKRTFSIAVPKDQQEDGLEVIESLLEPIAEKLGRKDHASWKYFTLVEALAFVNQHLHLVERSVES